MHKYDKVLLCADVTTEYRSYYREVPAHVGEQTYCGTTSRWKVSFMPRPPCFGETTPPSPSPSRYALNKRLEGQQDTSVCFTLAGNRTLDCSARRLVTARVEGIAGRHVGYTCIRKCTVVCCGMCQTACSVSGAYLFWGVT